MFENTIAVLFGGRSSEHEISLRSAVFILKNMPEKYNIIPVGINRDGTFFSLTGLFKSIDFASVSTADLARIVAGEVPSSFSLSQNKKSILLPSIKSEIELEFAPVLSSPGSTGGTGNFPLRILNLEASCIFPVLHGPNGEDGRLQGLFELAEVAYVGCDLRASVVGIDKDIQKRLARDAGINIAKYEVLHFEEFKNKKEKAIERIEKSLRYPCFIKPNSLGSAVGTGKAHDRSELIKILGEAFAFDQKALIEELIEGTEVECAFLGTSFTPRVTLAGEIAPKDFYSYEEKYAESSEASLFIPARLSAGRMEELRAEAIKVAKTMGLSGLSRIDFWNCTKPERFLFNEFNTLPGLTSISMFPKLWEHEGVSGKVWIEELLKHAYQRKQLTSHLQYGIHADL